MYIIDWIIINSPSTIVYLQPSAQQWHPDAESALAIAGVRGGMLHCMHPVQPV